MAGGTRPTCLQWRCEAAFDSVLQKNPGGVFGGLLFLALVQGAPRTRRRLAHARRCISSPANGRQTRRESTTCRMRISCRSRVAMSMSETSATRRRVRKVIAVSIACRQTDGDELSPRRRFAGDPPDRTIRGARLWFNSLRGGSHEYSRATRNESALAAVRGCVRRMVSPRTHLRVLLLPGAFRHRLGTSGCRR